MFQNDAAATVTAAVQHNATPPPNEPITPEMLQADSIHRALKDSLQNMDITDLKGVVTGENTIFKDALTSITELTVGFVPKLLGAIIVLWIGFKLIKMLKRGFTQMLDRRNADPSLRSFLTSFVDLLMKVLLIIMAMDIIGIKATSFIAILGALGLAIGMAMQGTLQNFAGGVIILLLKPFKVDDYIECGNYKGWVKDIHIFHTFVRPFNGRTIIIPNSELATKSLINHTKESQIRLDLEVGIAYGTDIDYAKEAFWEVINADPLILKDPVPKIAVKELNSSSVDIALWLWVNTTDYWTLWMRIRENIYKKMYEKGIEIPFPRLQVHTDKESH